MIDGFEDSVKEMPFHYQSGIKDPDLKTPAQEDGITTHIEKQLFHAAFKSFLKSVNSL